MSFLCRIPNVKNPSGGIGEVLLGRVFSNAKNYDSTYLEFVSANDSFYLDKFKKIGINPHKSPNKFDTESDHFYIYKDDFDKYLDYMKNEYGTDFSEKIKDGIKI